MRFSMKLAAVFLAALLYWAVPLLKIESSACHAREEVEALVNYLYSLGYNHQIPGLSNEQWKSIVLLNSAFIASKLNHESRLRELRAEMAAEVQKPLPSKQKLLTHEDLINGAELEFDARVLQTALFMRKVLTEKQMQEVFLVNPGQQFKGVTLTDEQQKQMIAIAATSTAQKEKLNHSLSQLLFDQTLILMHPVVDEKSVLDKQNQINEVHAQIANEDMKMKLQLRNVLDWQQKNKLYNNHRSNIFSLLALSNEEDSKIMDFHCKREAVTEHARRTMLQLSDQLMDRYKSLEPNEKIEKELSDLQQQLDSVAGQATITETEVVADIRSALTPEQREKLAQLLRQEMTGEIPSPPYPEETCMMHCAH
jgi:Spy/CpxP family protein refolding chaperone